MQSEPLSSAIESLFAEGHVHRPATEWPRSLVVVLGMWAVRVLRGGNGRKWFFACCRLVRWQESRHREGRCCVRHDHSFRRFAPHTAVLTVIPGCDAFIGHDVGDVGAAGSFSRTE